MATGGTEASVNGLGDGKEQWLAPFALKNGAGTTVFSVDIAGAVTAASSVTANSVVDAAGNVAFAANATIAGTLGVTGATTLAACDCTGNLSTDGTLVVDGAGTITGASTLTGDVTASGNLSIGKVASLAGIETALTAHAGGTQAAALALSSAKSVHNVATVGSAADSVKLPAASGSGAVHLIMNSAAANSMTVYGAGTDTINGVTSSTGVALAAGKCGLYVDFAAGTWFELKGA